MHTKNTLWVIPSSCTALTEARWHTQCAAALSGHTGIVDNTAIPWTEDGVGANSLTALALWQVLTPRTALSCLGRAYRQLRPNGQLWLLAEFNQQRYRQGYDGRLCLEYFLHTLRRCGFSIEQVQPLQGAQVLIVAHKRHDQRWRVSDVREHDVPAVADLFQRVFGHSMSTELWNWKYAHERGHNIVAWNQQGQIVAHYGGLNRQLHYFGRDEWGCQIADVMVEQTERAVLTRTGPFFLVAATQSELSRGPCLIGYGFPNARHMRVAEHLKLYAEVARLTQVVWPAQRTGGSALEYRVRRVQQPELIRAAVRELWPQMAQDLRAEIVGVRDPDWILYRYCQHPQPEQYQLWLVQQRWTHRPLGLMVIRPEDGLCQCLDVVAPLANLGYVVQAGRRLAAQLGCHELRCWITQRFAPLWAAHEDGDIRALDMIIPTSIRTEGPSVAELDQHWWLMAGDTDFR